MTDEPALLAVLIVCCALLVANLVGLVWFAVAHAKYGRDRFEAGIDHEHQWVPWADIYLGPGPHGEKVFSNGKGCLICHQPEPL